MDTVPEAREATMDDFQSLNRDYLAFPPVVGSEEFSTSNTETLPPSKLGCPEIPKRPRSAYNFFSQLMFTKLKEENSRKTSNEIVKEVVLYERPNKIVGVHVE